MDWPPTHYSMQFSVLEILDLPPSVGI